MSPLIEPDAIIAELFSGGEWLEGPVWLPDAHALRFSDIPRDRILEFDALSGETRVHDASAEFANGRTLDLNGDVVQCSHGRRRVERDLNGHVEAIAERWDGGRLNSPNDVIVASDGAVWFTDPPYGLHESGREGHPGSQDYEGCFVFRVDPNNGIALPVITDMVHPNGLAFSPDESTLYVADTGWFWNNDDPQHIRAYDVAVTDGVTSASNSRIFAEPTGIADGFRVDAEGNLWTSSGPSIQVFTPEGQSLLEFPMPQRISNLCFGGATGTDLYATSATSLYRVPTNARQAPRP